MIVVWLESAILTPRGRRKASSHGRSWQHSTAGSSACRRSGDRGQQVLQVVDGLALRQASGQAVSGVRALTFDIFGTTVDWRSGVAGEGRRLATLHGIAADWERVADAWRALYVPYMDRVRVGELPWTNFDRLHRLSLDQVIDDLGIQGFDEATREEFTLAWERLPSWPDAKAGLAALGQRFTVATLSNGNRSQQQALMRFTGLPFHRLLSAEDFAHYKPDPEVYLGAVAALGLEPGQVMMVAAHKSDLRGAQSAGLRAAFVERPMEKGPSGDADSLPDPLADVHAADFVDLADRLGRQLRSQEPT